MLAFRSAPTFEHRMVELVATNGERMVHAAVHGAARFPGVMADPAWVVPAPVQFVHDIGDSIALHHITPQVRSGKRAAYYSGYDRRNPAFS